MQHTQYIEYRILKLKENAILVLHMNNLCMLKEAFLDSPLEGLLTDTIFHKWRMNVMKAAVSFQSGLL